MEYILIGFLVTAIILIPIFYIIGRRKGINKLVEPMFKVGFLLKVASFKVQNRHIKKGGIAFVGDSITQDYNVYEYFSNHLVYNRGIGGDTTKGLLKRLNESIFDLEPKMIILLIGTNDFTILGSTYNEVYLRIVEIINEIKVRLPNINILLQSVYPVNPKLSKIMVGSRNNEDISKLNKLLKEIKDITYLNIYDILLKDNYLNPSYTTEGLHINEEGYTIITEEIMKYLK